MSRYDNWNGERDDIPETHYQACVYLDRVFYYIRNHNIYDFDNRTLLIKAHNRVNKMDFSEPYVSTYVDKSANMPAQEVYVGEVQEPTHPQNCGCPECGMF